MIGQLFRDVVGFVRNVSSATSESETGSGDESVVRRGARAAKERVKGGVSAVRDRRTRARRRLEDLFDRKTFASVAVAGSLGKLIEKGAIRLLDPAASVPWTRVLAWFAFLLLAVLISVYWERLHQAASEAAEAAEEAADAAQDAVDSDG